MDWTLIAVVALALCFDITNGFHDAANAIATSVATRAISPKVAVIGAAVLNFIGALISIEVATAVAKGIVVPDAVNLSVILAGIIGAILWNLLSWRFGMPTSSSHALIGGVAGAALAAGGLHAIKWEGLKDKVLLPSLTSSIIGFLLAGSLIIVILWIVKNRNTKKTNTVFKRLQVASASLVAFTHGTNDAQKTMGIIALALLIAHPSQQFHIPLWVIISSASAMALGTYLGGWRIIHTLGHKLVKLEPPQGFAAEAATASILWFTAHHGFPVSTTHTVSSSILGSGAASHPKEVRWKVARNILIAWVFTIPCAALIGASMNVITERPGGMPEAFSLAIVLMGLIFVTRNWGRESLAQVWIRLSPIVRMRKINP